MIGVHEGRCVPRRCSREGGGYSLCVDGWHRNYGSTKEYQVRYTTTATTCNYCYYCLVLLTYVRTYVLLLSQPSTKQLLSTKCLCWRCVSAVCKFPTPSFLFVSPARRNMGSGATRYSATSCSPRLRSDCAGQLASVTIPNLGGPSSDC